MSKPLRNSANTVKRALAEVVRHVRFIALSRATVKCVLFFLAGLLIMQVLTLDWYWGVVLASPFMLWTIIKNWRNANLYLVENTMTDMRHMLTTVRDTVSRENEVINALREDMLVKLRGVKNSYFINFGRLSLKVTGVLLLSIVVVSLAAFNVRFLDFEQDVVGGRMFQTYSVDDDLLQFELNESQDIYGERSVAALGLEELEVKIQPIKSDIDISQVDEAGQREFRQERSAQEILASNDGAYSDDIPKEYRKIVKFYFNEISKGG